MTSRQTIENEELRHEVVHPRGLRLGKYERRILLNVGPKPSVVPNRPPHPGKQAYESHHNAIMRLHQIGLISFARRQVDTEWFPNVRRQSTRSSRPRTYVYRREIYLTEFGQKLVKRIRPRLEKGKPIRWKRHLLKLQEPGNELLLGFDRFRANLLTEQKIS